MHTWTRTRARKVGHVHTRTMSSVEQRWSWLPRSSGNGCSCCSPGHISSIFMRASLTRCKFAWFANGGSVTMPPVPKAIGARYEGRAGATFTAGEDGLSCACKKLFFASKQMQHLAMEQMIEQAGSAGLVSAPERSGALSQRGGSSQDTTTPAPHVSVSSPKAFRLPGSALPNVQERC